MFIKKVSAIILCLCITVGLMPAGVFTAAAENITADTSWYGGGNAEEYDISTAGELAGLSELVNSEGATFEGKVINLMADIDFNGSEWVPIGHADNYFYGTFEGHGHTVKGLSVTEGYSTTGLFGTLYGKVNDLTVRGSMICSDSDYIGGIAGVNYGTIINCITLCTLQGNSFISGIAGSNNGNIINCCSLGSVSGNNRITGITGINGYSANIINCYSASRLQGNGVSVVCGISGLNNGNITNAFWLSSTASVGSSYNRLEPENLLSFSQDGTTCTVSSEVNGTKSLVAIFNTWVKNNKSDYPELYKWREASDTQENNGLPVFDSSDYWSNHTDISWYSNSSAAKYEIGTAEQLAGFALLVNEHGINFLDKTVSLTANINLSAYEWIPISHSGSRARFGGTFDGNGHSISGLSISTDYDSTGLFGNLYGYVKNVNVSANINSKLNNVGIIAGTIENVTISGCGTSGSVKGTEYIGGIVGYIKTGSVINSSNKALVTGTNYVGGIAGINTSNEQFRGIMNCYNLGSVNGSYCVGGIVGINKGEVYNCYTAGQITGDSMTGAVCGNNYDANSSIKNTYYLTGTSTYNTGSNSGTIFYVYPFNKADNVCTLVGSVNEDNDLARVLSYGSSSISGLSRWKKAAGASDNNGFPFFNDMTLWTDNALYGWYNGNDSQFIIKTAEELAGLAYLVNSGNTMSGKTVMLENDIDLSSFEWVPIAGGEFNNFEGIFDGKGHTVSGIVIYSMYNSIGLFGHSSGTVKNLKIDINSDCETVSRMGGIVGSNKGRIEGCEVNGRVSGYSECAGISGYNDENGVISECINNAEIHGASSSGGIAGKNLGIIINCGNMGNVNADSNAAGISGSNSGKILNSYNTGTIYNLRDKSSGVTCINESGGLVSNCYSSGALTAYKDGSFSLVGGENSGTVSHCFAITGSCYFIAYKGTTSDLVFFTQEGTDCTLESSLNGSYDLLEVLNSWVTSNTSAYPDLIKWRAASSEDENSGCPLMGTALYWNDRADTSWYGNGSASFYTIRNENELAGLALLVNSGTSFEGKTVTLSSDMDLSALKWIPIGYADDGVHFAGTFNGNNKKITGIVIQQTHSYNGLFGVLDGTVKNLSVDAMIRSGGNTGIIAGLNNGSIFNCTVFGTVTAASNVGGIAGINSNNIINCCSFAHISGNELTGGIAGTNNGLVSNCHSSAPVNGSEKTGGIVGYNTSSVSNCFVLKETSENISGLNSGTEAQTSFFTSNELTCTLETAVNGTTDLLTVLNNGAAVSSEFSEWRLIDGFISDGLVPVLSSMYQSTETIDGREYYLIYNVSDLLTFAQKAAANSYVNAKLARDIDLSGSNFSTITNFNGIFLGNNHKIENLNINSSSSYMGFFGKLGSSAKVSDLTFVNCRVVTSSSYAGIICGQSAGQIFNCHAIGGNVTARGTAGGLVGQNNVASGTYLRNCTSSASVNVSGNYAGGIVGYSNNGKIINCRNSGGILCTGSYVGGIVGKAEAGEIANCANLGNILCTGSSSGRVGGIVGDNGYTVSTTGINGTNTQNCYNAGYIKLSSSSSQYVGGIVGSAAGASTGVVKNCYWLDGTASKGFYLYTNTLANSTVQTFTCSGTSCTAAKENGNSTDLTTILNAWVDSKNSSYSNLLTKWNNASNIGVNLGKPVNAADICAGPALLEISVSDIAISTSGFTYLGSTSTYYGEYIINGSTSAKKVTVNSFWGTITLDRVNIYGSAPFAVTGSASTSIVLKNNNRLESTSSNPSLSVGQNTEVVFSGTGSASFLSDADGAAIGSARDVACGSIVINGGNINAFSNGGAGIGGNSAHITINGGTVYALDENGGAGIGGASGLDGGTVVINGGNVTAASFYGGAGIGGGKNGNSGKITINNGTVRVEADDSGTSLGMDIGNGYMGTAGDSSDNFIAICGGNVMAVNSNAAPQAYDAEYYESKRQPVYPVLFNMGMANAGHTVRFFDGTLPERYTGKDLTLDNSGRIMLWLPMEDYGISSLIMDGRVINFSIVSEGSSMSVSFGEYRTITYIIDGTEIPVSYKVGDSVTVSDIPEVPGYTFERWMPELPEVMPDEDITVTALLSGGYISNNNGTHVHLYIPFEYSVLSECSCSETTIPPTDSEPGYTLHSCEFCSYSYRDNEVPAQGHDFDTQWHHDDFEHWHECSRCGEYSDRGEHEWVWVEDIPATCIQSGIKHEECSICHLTRKEKTVSEIIANHPSLDSDGFCTICGKGQDPVLNNNYYEISSVGQLYRFAEMVNEGKLSINGRLMNDIVINRGVLNEDKSLASNTSGFRKWSAIAVDTPYIGTFDGNGFSISGLYSDDAINYNGFFSRIGSSGVIKNLTLKDSYILCNIGGAALCGQSMGTINHCFVSANVTGTGYIGGIVGNSYLTLTNCGADISLNCSSSGVGGLACMAEGTVSNCYVTGTIDCNGSLVHPVIPMSNGNIRITNTYYLITLPSTTPGIGGTAVSYSQLSSGETAWLLNQSSSGNTGIWSQGRETPVFASANNPPVYKVTYVQGSNGTLSGGEYFKAGETVTVNLNDPESGYSCILYVDGTVIGKNIFTMPYSDCTVSAEFIKGGTQNIWGIKIIAGAEKLNVGGTLQLSAVTIPENKPVSVTWSSGKPAVATVNRSGLVKGVNLGNVSITAADPYGNTDTVNLVVSSEESAVKIISTEGSFSKKISWWKSYSTATMELDFYIYNCNDAVEYRWFSSNPDVNVDNGHITNTGWFSRSSNISLIAYDAQGNIIAKDTVKVSFYKFSWQSRFAASSVAEDAANTPSPADEAPKPVSNTFMAKLFAAVLNVFKLLFASLG